MRINAYSQCMLHPLIQCMDRHSENPVATAGFRVL